MGTKREKNKNKINLLTMAAALGYDVFLITFHLSVVCFLNSNDAELTQ